MPAGSPVNSAMVGEVMGFIQSEFDL